MNANSLLLITGLRHELHAHPELSGQEIQTKRRLQAFLQTHTSLEITDCGAWFHARKPGGSALPPIAFRADMDAVAIQDDPSLPYASTVSGVAHKCGHDGHCAVLAGLALELDTVTTDRDVYCIFQHAEETGQGARECAGLVTEKGIAEIYAFHNMSGQFPGCVGIRSGTMNCASQGVAFHFQGLPAHASLPETGKNPAFAVADLLRALPGIAGTANFSGQVWCTVIQVAVGSRNFGIAAGDGSLLLTCRGEQEADMLKLTATLENAARQFAVRDGLDLTISLHDVFPETVNHPEAVDRVRAVCKRLGYPVHAMPEPMRSSEDMGHFLKATNGALFLIHTGDRPPIHTPEYDFDDCILEQAVAMFKALI
jgi:amidohydrolase